MLQGFDVELLDANGDILDSYMSYNQNAVEANVLPGQTLSVELSTDNASEVAGIQSNYCCFGDFSDMTEEKYPETYLHFF